MINSIDEHFEFSGSGRSAKQRDVRMGEMRGSFHVPPCSTAHRHATLAAARLWWYVLSPAGGSWRASRCSFHQESHDATQSTTGIEKGAENTRYPLQLPTHRAAREGRQIP